MTTNNVSITAVILNKRPLSEKRQVRSRSPSAGKYRSDESRLNRTMTAVHRSSSKLANARIKTSIYSSVLGYHSSQKDEKLERHSTISDTEVRLPVVYSLMNEQDQRRMSELRRRQIYALNHFMRDLEQEQFRQFCETHEIKTDKSDNPVNKNGDIK